MLSWVIMTLCLILYQIISLIIYIFRITTSNIRIIFTVESTNLPIIRYERLHICRIYTVGLVRMLSTILPLVTIL